jgi:hypothetical protein
MTGKNQDMKYDSVAAKWAQTTRRRTLQALKSAYVPDRFWRLNQETFAAQGRTCGRATCLGIYTPLSHARCFPDASCSGFATLSIEKQMCEKIWARQRLCVAKLVAMDHTRDMDSVENLANKGKYLL